ncbi:hypothetical protein [Massilia horti]|uniref:DUF1640 domain-containing protein n=1 Tax=Massilia horti TaxID=2562153 RepID=A0A4Y9T9G6_9BURK|nr:hypothetical protein [Massilia horti]TFW34849.1 hypothetical protein E4O92_03175 [Massilia horti]
MAYPEPQSTSAGLDNGRHAADHRLMEDRLTKIETDLATVKADVSNIRANCATKEDLAVVKADIANLHANGATKEDLAVVKADIANIRANGATKEDLAKTEARLYEAMNLQTWRFIAWMTGTMAMMMSAVYFVARNVH